MPIAGFSYSKISAERTGVLGEKDKIENKVRISAVNDGKVRMGKDERAALNVQFEFIVDYAKAGKIELLGNILFYDSPEKLKELAEGWQKNKKVPPEFTAFIYNFIFGKANIKAIQLEDEMGLPLHLKLPRIKLKQS